MKIYCVGYMVLRQPQFNFDELGRGLFSSEAPKIDGLYYGGVDRMPWFDIDENFYEGILPGEINDIRKRIRVNELGLRVCDRVEDAKLLLSYSNSVKNASEIIQIFSSLPLGKSDVFPEIPDSEALGYDLYCDGYGSAIREGIFKAPNLFKDYIPSLTTFGLFCGPDEIVSDYLSFYRKVADEGSIETFKGAIYKVYLKLV